MKGYSMWRSSERSEVKIISLRRSAPSHFSSVYAITILGSLVLVVSRQIVRHISQRLVSGPWGVHRCLQYASI